MLTQTTSRTPSPSSILKQGPLTHTPVGRGQSGKPVTPDKKVRFNDRKSKELEARTCLARVLYRRIPALLKRLEGRGGSAHKHKQPTETNFLHLMEVFAECVPLRDVHRWATVALNLKLVEIEHRVTQGFYMACDAFEYLSKLVAGDREIVQSALEELDHGLYDQHCVKVVACVLPDQPQSRIGQSPLKPPLRD